MSIRFYLVPVEAAETERHGQVVDKGPLFDFFRLEAAPALFAGHPRSLVLLIDLKVRSTAAAHNILQREDPNPPLFHYLYYQRQEILVKREVN